MALSQKAQTLTVLTVYSYSNILVISTDTDLDIDQKGKPKWHTRLLHALRNLPPPLLSPGDTTFFPFTYASEEVTRQDHETVVEQRVVECDIDAKK